MNFGTAVRRSPMEKENSERIVSDDAESDLTPDCEVDHVDPPYSDVEQDGLETIALRSLIDVNTKPEDSVENNKGDPVKPTVFTGEPDPELE